MLNLSSATYLVGPVDGDYTSSFLSITAGTGAQIDLSGLINISGNNSLGVKLYAMATNGVINLSSLTSFGQNGGMYAENGGSILAPNLNSMSVSLYVDSSSTMLLTNLSEISGGGHFGAPNVTIEAGPGAMLNLSSASYIMGPYDGDYTSSYLSVTADAGAVINMSGVTNIIGNNSFGVKIYADVTNSVINLLGLISMTGPAVLSQENGGLILLNTNAVYSGVSIQLAPAISGQPQNVATPIGSSVLFAIVADGSQPLSYQWYFGTNPVAGATGAQCSIPNAPLSSAGSYWCVVSNSFGSLTSQVATLQFIGPPTAAIDDSGTWVAYAEYFWDSAPALSNGVPVSIAPGETFGLGYPGSLAINLDLSGLPSVCIIWVFARLTTWAG